MADTDNNGKTLSVDIYAQEAKAKPAEAITVVPAAPDGGGTLSGGERQASTQPAPKDTVEPAPSLDDVKKMLSSIKDGMTTHGNNDDFSSKLSEAIDARERAAIRQQGQDMGLIPPTPDAFEQARKMLDDPIPQAPKSGSDAGSKVIDGKAMIQAAAQKAGVSPDYLAKAIIAESGGNMNAKAATSSARGLGQFTSGTRDAILQKYGVDAWANDPGQQVTALAHLTADNRASLTKDLGREPSDAETYMAAFLGAGGASKFLNGYSQNPNEPAASYVDPKAAEANKTIFYAKDGTPRTAGQVFSIMAKKVGDNATSSAALGLRIPTTKGVFNNAMGGQPNEVPGMKEAGNIDLSTRPKVQNEDGSFSTVRSMSTNIDGQEVLLPTISDDGKHLTDEEAVQQDMDTGRNLGKFNTPDDATNYAEALHNEQSSRFGLNDKQPKMEGQTRTNAPQPKEDFQGASIQQGAPVQPGTWAEDLGGYLESQPKDGVVSNVLKSIGQTGVAVFRGFASGTQAFYNSLDNLADYLSQATGAKKGGLFTMLSKASDYWVDKADSLYNLAPNARMQNGRIMDYQKFMTGLVGDILGGAVPGFMGFELDKMGLAAAKGYAKNGITGALTEQGKTFALNEVMKAANALPIVLRAAGLGGLFASQTYAEGGKTVPELAQGFGTGVGAAFFGGDRGKPAVRKLSTMEEARTSAFLSDTKNEETIRQALKEGKIDNNMADMLLFFGYIFPDRDNATVLKVMDYVKKATASEMVDAGVVGNEGIVIGRTRQKINPESISVALELYQGADVETVVHEHAHLFFDNLTGRKRDEMLSWYTNETFGKENRPTPDEFFADKFSSWFIQNRMWEGKVPNNDGFSGAFSGLARRINRVVSLALKTPGAVPPGDVFEQFVSAATGRKGDVFSDIAKTGENPLYNELTKWTEKNQVVYHGTPYDFEKFSTDKIGSGEGAQSYGWGLYFSSNKKVADWYKKTVRDDMAAPRRYFKGNELQKGTPAYHAATLLASPGKTLASVRREVKGWIDNAKPGENVDHYKGVLETLNAATSKKDFKQKAAEGKTLSVDVPPSDKMLDWDKPLSQQTNFVKQKIDAIGKTINTIAPNALDDLGGDWSVLFGKDKTGEEFYSTLSNIVGGDKQASQVLDSAGIPGHQYLDQGSRGKKSGTHNLVIYNAENASILKDSNQVVPSSQSPGMVNDVKPKDQFEQFQDWSKVGSGDKHFELIDKADNAAMSILYDGAKDTKDPIFGLGGVAQKKAVNINLDYIKGSQDIKDVISKVAEAITPEINDARRNVQSNKETLKKARQLLASDLGITEQTLLNRQRGEAFNAEQAVAARMVLVSSAERLMKAAQDIANGNNSDAALIAFRQRVEAHGAIQAQVSGMAAEAGRALQSFQILSKATKLAKSALSVPGLNVSADILETAGGKRKLEELAENLASTQEAGGASAQQVNKFVDDFRTRRFTDWVLKARAAGMLSGIRTHFRNTLGNATTLALAVPERALAAAIGTGSRWLNPTNQENVLWGESAAMVKGMVSSLGEALQLGWYAARTGESKYGRQRIDIDIPTGGARAETSFVRATSDFIWNALDIPFKVLGGEDDFFKTLSYRAELNALAYRQAHSEGLDGEKLTARIEELKNYPDNDLQRRALNFAEYTTFNNKLPSGMQRLFAGVNSSFWGRFVIPFQRTPFNVFKYSIARTPLAAIFQDVRQDLSTPGPNQDLAISRIIFGSSLMTFAGTLAASGLITGAGPTNPGEKAIWKQMYQPYSIRIGNKWVSYNNLAEPLTSYFGLAADFYDASMDWKSAENHDESVWGALASATVVSLSKNFTSKLFLTGLTEVSNALSDPDHYGAKFIQSSVASFVPTISADWARGLDPKVRMVKSVIDAIKNKVPLEKNTLAPRRDIFGDVTIMQAMGPAWLGDMNLFYSPLSEKKTYADDAVKEMIRLGMRVSMPSQTQTFDGVPVELDNKQYSRFLDIMGHETHMGNIRDRVNRLVSSPSYQRVAARDSGPDGQASAMIYDVFRMAREEAKAILFKESFEIQNVVNQENFNKFNTMRGNQ